MHSGLSAGNAVFIVCCSHQHDQNTITGRRLSSPCQAEGPQLRAVEATALPLRHPRATVGMVSWFSVIVNYEGRGLPPCPFLDSLVPVDLEVWAV